MSRVLQYLLIGVGCWIWADIFLFLREEGFYDWTANQKIPEASIALALAVAALVIGQFNSKKR